MVRTRGMARIRARAIASFQARVMNRIKAGTIA